jgi:Flp pilus assembly protein TadG
MRRRHHMQSAPLAIGTRRGATTVEVALILPVLFLFIFASFEFSRLNMLKHLAGAAAYEGAREGIVIGATVGDVTTRVNAILASGGVYDADITTTPTTISEATTEVVVQVTIPVEGNFWVMPKYVSGTITGSCRLSTEREG